MTSRKIDLFVVDEVEADAATKENLRYLLFYCKQLGLEVLYYSYKTVPPKFRLQSANKRTALIPLTRDEVEWACDMVWQMKVLTDEERLPARVRSTPSMLPPRGWES